PRAASCCPSSHHSSRSFLVHSEFDNTRALSPKHKQEARTVPVIDGLVMSSNQFVRAAWVDLLVKLPLDGARTMSFRGHTVQTVDARSLVGHVVGFRSQHRALNPVIGFALIRLATPELVWNPACYYSVRIEFHGDAWAEGAVMKELIDFSSVQY